MNQQLIDSINSGIYLARRKVLLPWSTKHSDLGKLGHPIVRKEGRGEYLTWKNEIVLNGLVVDLDVFHETGVFAGVNEKLEWATAFIDEQALQQTKTRLDTELGQGVFKESGNEYQYSWRLKNATVLLWQRDRFGHYWQAVVKHNSSSYAGS